MKLLSKRPGLRIFLLGGIIGTALFVGIVFLAFYLTDWGERSSSWEVILKPFAYLFWPPLWLGSRLTPFFQYLDLYSLSYRWAAWWIREVLLLIITFIYSGLIFLLIRHVVRFFRKRLHAK